VIFQASKQLKKFRKWLSMNVLTESGILGDISSEELVKEKKGSDMWKKAVNHEDFVHDICLNLHAYS
jgi:hypothetical protein